MCAVLERIEDQAEGEDATSLGDVLDALGERSFGPLIMLLAIVELSPVGGIPGVPTFLALNVLILAAQVVIGQEHVWIPGALEKRAIDAGRLKGALERMHPVARRMDRWFHARGEVLAGASMTRIAGVTICLLCLPVPPLEVIPFGSAVPMAAIAILGFAMTVHDGYLMIAGLVAAGAAIGGSAYLLLSL